MSVFELRNNGSLAQKPAPKARIPEPRVSGVQGVFGSLGSEAPRPKPENSKPRLKSKDPTTKSPLYSRAR